MDRITADMIKKMMKTTFNGYEQSAKRSGLWHRSRGLIIKKNVYNRMTLTLHPIPGNVLNRMRGVVNGELRKEQADFGQDTYVTSNYSSANS